MKALNLEELYNIPAKMEYIPLHSKAGNEEDCRY